MIPDIENYYQHIGQGLVDLIPDDFENAWIGVEMIDDVWSLGIFYLKSDGRVQYMNEGMESVAENFREMRQKFKESGEAPWTTATYKLSRTGKMNIDFGYQDVSDFGLASERRDVWIKKHLGENPKIDWS